MSASCVLYWPAWVCREGSCFYHHGRQPSIQRPARDADRRDHNSLALAIVMVLPLINYFREQLHRQLAASWLVPGALFLSVLAIISTGSRGGFLASGGGGNGLPCGVRKASSGLAGLAIALTMSP